MAAHEGKAMMFCNGEAPFADFFLDAAAVNDKSICGNEMGIAFQPGGAAIWVNGKQYQIASGNGCFVQPTMDSTTAQLDGKKD